MLAAGWILAISAEHPVHIDFFPFGVEFVYERLKALLRVHERFRAPVECRF